MQNSQPALLNRAVLHYGASTYPVTPCASLPLPPAFDFAHGETCARLILAIMSNASGGHTLRDCRVMLAPEGSAANIVCNGAHVYYTVAERPKLTIPELLARHNANGWLWLGDVQTDQYGDGYTRAVWRDSYGPRIPNPRRVRA